MKLHLVKEHGKIAYCCDLCGEGFMSARKLTTHMWDAHEDPKKNEVITCEHCGEMFKTPHAYQQHAKIKVKLILFC